MCCHAVKKLLTHSLKLHEVSVSRRETDKDVYCVYSLNVFIPVRRRLCAVVVNVSSAFATPAPHLSLICCGTTESVAWEICSGGISAHRVEACRGTRCDAVQLRM